MERKLRRLPDQDDDRWLGGVCGGIAYWLEMPVWVVRLICVLAISAGLGMATYVLLWIFLPTWDKKPSDFNTVTGD